MRFASLADLARRDPNELPAGRLDMIYYTKNGKQLKFIRCGCGCGALHYDCEMARDRGRELRFEIESEM